MNNFLDSFHPCICNAVIQAEGIVLKCVDNIWVERQKKTDSSHWRPFWFLSRGRFGETCLAIPAANDMFYQQKFFE